MKIFFGFVFLFGILMTASLPRSSGPQQRKSVSEAYLAYIGTYTAKTSSKGIYVYRFDAKSGKLTSLGLAAESADPSFLAVHPNGKYLYAVHEAGKKSMVSAFVLDKATGKLALLNQVPALGEDPCYVSLDKTGKYILIANYTSGNVAVFPILPDGHLGEHTAVVTDAGIVGPNKERQEGPHAHWIGTSPDNHFALAADLGLDEVLVYRFDAANGALSPNAPPFAKVDPGAGPRHFAFHPNGKFAYVLTEMAATITAFSYNRANGSLAPLQTVATLPKDYTGPKEAAELVVHPSGKFLYASNRAGVDAIAAFTIDPAKGTLKLLDKFSTNGKTPRNFSIDPTGKFLLAANQESDNIVVFRIDTASGKLTPTGEVLSVTSPVCITFVSVP
jgi:6-phosphogluconolactonase